MIHSFLMAGQSNIAGRGFLKDVAPIYDEHIKMLRNGRWQTMVEPINYDRPNAGIGLSASFAAAWRMKNKPYLPLYSGVNLLQSLDSTSMSEA